MPPLTNQRGLFGLSTLSLVASGLVIAAVLAAFAGQALVLRRAQQEKATLELQLQYAIKDRDAAVQIAKANEKTIKDLQQEKADLEVASQAIEKARVEAESSRSARETVISSQASSASSKAITAPVISDTITAILADRKRRPR